MTRYAMAVDTRRCIGCQACVVACKQENGLPAGHFRCWVAVETRGTYPDLRQRVHSERCGQCSNSPCVNACPTGACFVADGGIVLVDRDKCTGCAACVATCPYGARSIHPDGYADKCTFCLHRLRAGQGPACVENCPSGALVFGDTDDPRSAISLLLRRRPSEVLRPEAGTQPNLHIVT